jgi:hypothetical protein
MTDPYAALGLPPTATLEEAKAAYRRLAMQHHPDRGGDAEAFKRVKEAWEWIEAGKPVVRPAAPPAAAQARPAPRPARPRRPLPRVDQHRDGTRFVVVEVPLSAALSGCTVSFVMGGAILDWSVPPGHPLERPTPQRFSLSDDVAPRPGDLVTVEITLRLAPGPYRLAPESALFADARAGHLEVDVKVCALFLFVGGELAIPGPRGGTVKLRIPPGCDPAERRRVEGQGYPSWTHARGVGEPGDLLVRLLPIFTSPAEFTDFQRVQVERLAAACAPAQN